MTEENGIAAQGAAQQQQVVNQEVSNHLAAALGGINGSSATPAMDALISSQSQVQQPTAQTQEQVVNPLVNSSMNQQGAPDVPVQQQQQGKTFAEQQQAIEQQRAQEQAQLQQDYLQQQAIPGQQPNQNELVNLTGDEPGAGPTDQNQALETPAANQEYIVDNPLLKIKQQTQPEAQVPNPLANIQGIDQVNQYLASKIPGMENLEALISSHSALTQASQSAGGVQAEYDQLVGGLKNLHPDLIEAMRLNEAGEDFRGYLASNPSIDYTTPEKDLNKRSLVDAFFPGTISDADYDAADKNSENYDANTERYVRGQEERALERFNSNKGQYNTRVDEYIAQKQGRNAEYKASVIKSSDSVKNIFPDVEDSYMNSIQEKVLNNGIDNLFYDDKGNLKEDAMARFVMASDDGKNLLTALQTIAQNKAKTEANLDIITRSQRTAPEQGGAGMMTDVNEDRVQEHIKSLVGGVNVGQRY